jgi:hypothetical protein
VKEREDDNTTFMRKLRKKWKGMKRKKFDWALINNG